MIFCTLFDSNYIDKGIVLYNSLSRLNIDFKLYILAMDEKSYNILSDMHLTCTEIISLDEIMKSYSELYDARNNRSKGEFCWTCTPFIIHYVLAKRNEVICTYVDSDLYFYSDPSVLIDEMGSKTVQIVEHRFTQSYPDRKLRSKSGTYCVQFNTFKNTPDALKLLKWWCDRCSECCTSAPYAKSLGDQGYLEHWGELGNVSLLKNLGGGVAPWNVAQYKLIEDSSEGIFLEEKKTNKRFRLVFYHFHHILHISPNQVNISVYVRHWGTDEKLIQRIYLPYLSELHEIKSMLKAKYGIYPSLYKHPGLSRPGETVSLTRKIAGKLRHAYDHPFHRIFYKISGKLLRLTQGRKDIIEVDKHE